MLYAWVGIHKAKQQREVTPPFSMPPLTFKTAILATQCIALPFPCFVWHASLATIQHACTMQAANVDATLSRLRHQQAQQQERKRLAAVVAAAAEISVKQEDSLDPDFSPGLGQIGNPEAEDRASGAAQMAHQMSQVCIV